MKSRLLKGIRWIVILVLPLVLPAATIAKTRGRAARSSAAKAGKKVFEQNCAMCHYANQTKNKIGPGMKGILKNKLLPYSHKPATIANVRDQIETGNPRGKPMPMPPFGSKLSKTQIDDLIAYLKTL